MERDSRFYELEDREQERMLAPSLRQAVEEEPGVLALDAAVEQLDLSGLEACYREVGHPAYPPKVMLKVLIYGYSLGLRASRQLARACRKDDDFRFLAHGLGPDFRTLCRFRRRHAKALKKLFVQTVALCQEAGLVRLGHVAIDGAKVRANRSGRTLKQAQAVLEEALAEAEQADVELGETGEQAEGEAEECRFMKTREGVWPAYNTQVAVDSAQQVIVAQEVVTAPNDRRQLPELVAQVADNCGAKPAAVSADGGYCSQQAIIQVSETGTALYLPVGERGLGRMEWVEQEGAFRCPAGQWLRPYRIREGKQIYRTHRCGGCAQRSGCGVRGRLKEVHVPLASAAVQELTKRMRTPEAKAFYARRKAIVEPVFAHLKHNRGFRRFLLRDREGAGAEWSLACIAYNLAKWAKVWARLAPSAGGGAKVFLKALPAAIIRCLSCCQSTSQLRRIPI